MSVPFIRRLASVKYSLSLLDCGRPPNPTACFGSVLQGVNSSLESQVRSYAFKSELKIKWIRPEKISCIKPEKSGDQGTFPSRDPKEFPLEFQKSAELADASDMVKKVFSLEFQPRKKGVRIGYCNLIDQVKRHDYDRGSMESRIAYMTGVILNLQQVMEQFPRDKRKKVVLKELIDKRKKFLKYLRRWDYKRFEWLLEKLNLIYKPPPSEFKWVTRKDSLRKLTDKYCEDLRNERLNEYRASLDVQKLDFLEKKAETLQWIREEEMTCGADSSVLQEDIDAVLEKIKQIKTSDKDTEVKSK